METEDRKRIRCPQINCRTVQFVNKTHTCVKCKQPFNQSDTTAQSVSACPQIIPDKAKRSRFDDDAPVDGKVMDFSFWLAFVFWDLRKQQGKTQPEMAERVGFHRQYLNKIEKGKNTPTVVNLVRICEALEVTPSHVLRMTEFLTFGT